MTWWSVWETAVSDEAFARELAEDTAEQKQWKKKPMEEWMRPETPKMQEPVDLLNSGRVTPRYVKDKRTDKDAWHALLESNLKSYGWRMENICSHACSSLKGYFARWKHLVWRLKTKTTWAVMKSYEPLVTALETIHPNQLTLENWKKKPLLWNTRLKRSDKCSTNSEDTRGSAFSGRKLGFKCYGCGRFGHERADCSEDRQVEKEGLREDR